MRTTERDFWRRGLVKRVEAIIRRRDGGIVAACRQVARSERRAGRKVSVNSLIRWRLAVQARGPGALADGRRGPTGDEAAAARCFRVGLGLAFALLCREMRGRVKLAPALLEAAARSAGFGRRTLELARSSVMDRGLPVAAEANRVAAGLVDLAEKIRECRAAIAAAEALSRIGRPAGRDDAGANDTGDGSPAER